MRLFRFLALEALRCLSDLEFRYHRDNSHTRFRHRYAEAMGMKFQKPFSFGQGFYLRNPGNIQVGKNCSFGSFTRIWNYHLIEIGDDFLGAELLTINTGSHQPDTLLPCGNKITIGRRVWVGSNVTILAGATIGDDAIIAAGSVVLSGVEPGTIVGGVPARPIGQVHRPSNAKIWSPWN